MRLRSTATVSPTEAESERLRRRSRRAFLNPETLASRWEPLAGTIAAAMWFGWGAITVLGS